MTKTIKNNNKIKKNNNKTRRNNKNKITNVKKSEFIKAILKEWKKQSGGCYEKDKTSQYKDDYYLSLNKTCNFYNHIHVILKNFNDIKYVMKKMGKDNKVVHSQQVKIDILSEPKKIVRTMILRFKEFSKH